MRVGLLELLQRCEIAHPTRLTRVCLSDEELCLWVEGYPWWRDKEKHAGDGLIKLVFAGVSDGQLSFNDICSPANDVNDEVLEEFSVEPVSRESWAGPHEYSIYANEPVPEPLKLITRLEDYLSDLDASKYARDFLNMPSGLISRFADISSSGSCLIAAAPLTIRDIICDELKHQSVHHNVVKTHCQFRQRLIVRLGGSTIFCDGAFADLD